MSADTPATYVGRTGTIALGTPAQPLAIEIAARCVAERRRFGRVDVTMEPVAGRGSVTLNAENVDWSA